MYKETGLLDSMFFQRHFDPIFLAMDRWIFGFQPSLVFMHKLPYLWVSETLYFAYFCYYLMIPVIGLALYFRDRETFVRYLTVVSVVFYCCYLTYIFFPVIGPRAVVKDIPDFTQDVSVYREAYDLSTPDSIQGGVFFGIMGYIYDNVEKSGGAAFPSSHVAVALATLFFSWQFLKRIRWVHLVFVLLLMVATVYCRYHYVVDVFAGVLTALVLVPIGDKLYATFDRTRQEKPLAAE
jgi:membrane-associated phospholipid phosphatase